MDLNSFINTAINQVRQAKKPGKQGRKARQDLRKGELELAQVKQQIIDVATACEQRAWHDKRLILRHYVSTCKCCRHAQQTTTAIYLEQTHKKLGSLWKRLDEIQSYSFPHIGRKEETFEDEDFLCQTCFREKRPLEHKERPEEPNPKQFKLLTKWEEEYRLFSAEWTRKKQAHAWSRLQPTCLLLSWGATNE